MSESVNITGTGYYLPDRVLSNADLEKMVDTSDEWIVTRTGIKTRRIASDRETVSHMAAEASRKALAAAGIGPEQVDMILVGTFTPDRLLPAAACLVQAKLGINEVPCFDFSAACSAFLYGAEMARGFLRLEGYKNVLVVAAEKISSMVDWQDRNTCVLFGDGAGAAVFSRGGASRRVLDTVIGADGSKDKLLEIPGGGSEMPFSAEVLEKRLQFVRMEGKETFKLAVSRMTEACRTLIERNGLTPDDIAWLVPHQANLRIIKGVGKALKIPDERVYVNVDRLGNMSGATVPIALAEMEENHLLKPGDRVILVAFGGGLTWGAVLLEW